jgi:hypothetical protein
MWSPTTNAVRTPRRLRSLWRFRVGAVAGLVLVTTVALLPSGPAFGAGTHQRLPDPPLQAARVVSLPRGGKPVLSSQPVDYIPATIAGKKVVLDPRSSVGDTDPSCEVPPEGVVATAPLQRPSDAVQEAFGGVWDCLSSVPPVGTGFVAGIDAAKAAPTVSKLSARSLYTTPPLPADAGSVKTTTVKVNGKRVKVFTYRATAISPSSATFEVASTEPHAHLLVSATTLSVTKPLLYLTAMLKAGAGKTPRAA